MNMVDKLSKHSEPDVTEFSEQQRNNADSALKSALKSSASKAKVCKLCNGHGYGGPCHEAIMKVKEELMNYVKSLFTKKQAEFINFIENDLEVENQVNVKSENVLKTFYKNHNTVNKMYDNFRLCK